jgi:hypothetical protein
MSTQNDKRLGHGLLGGLGRRFWATDTIIFTILAIILCPIEYYDYKHEPPDYQNAVSFKQSMNTKVEDQLNKLEEVDPFGLLEVYDNTLKNEECSWVFLCHDKPQPAVVNQPPVSQFGGYTLGKAAQTLPQSPTLPELTHVTSSNTPPATPQLQIPPQPSTGELVHTMAPPPIHRSPSFPVDFFSNFWIRGPIIIPTWNTVRGTPYAMIRMVKAIRDKGWRAVAMFVSCTILFAVAWGALANSKSSNGWIVYTALVLSPLCISILVYVVQWVARGALDACGWVGGMFAILLTHSAALSLIVGVRHFLKGPKELVEAVEKLH